MLRRSLEKRSFRCRVWCHIEVPVLQSAIVSRCITTNLPGYSHLPKIDGILNPMLWIDPREFEMELQRAK